MHEVNRVRIIKQLLSQTAAMREIQQYAFFDEAFLRLLDWEPTDTLEVQSPVSENWRRLVTTLMPHLFQAVWHNATHHDALRFFEWARTWQVHQAQTIERKSLVGIMFEKKHAFDFYDGKALLAPLFQGLSLEVTWRTQNSPTFPWYAPYQTAELFCDGVMIGKAGMVQSAFITKIAEHGTAFIFELDGNFLLGRKEVIKKFVPLAKYPEVERDMSVLVSLSLSVDHLQSLIKNVDKRIVRIMLVDFFQKPEWLNERSLTFRFVIRDDMATLMEEQVDALWDE